MKKLFIFICCSILLSTAWAVTQLAGEPVKKQKAPSATMAEITVATPGAWNIPSTWSGGTLPGSGDIISFSTNTLLATAAAGTVFELGQLKSTSGIAAIAMSGCTLNLYGVSDGTNNVALNLTGGSMRFGRTDFGSTATYSEIGAVVIKNNQVWHSTNATKDNTSFYGGAAAGFNLSNYTITKTGTGYAQISGGFDVKDGKFIILAGGLCQQSGNSKNTTSTRVDHEINSTGTLLIQANTKTVTISGGTTTLNGGTLSFQASGGISFGNNIVLGAASTIIFNGSSSATLNSPISGSADLTINLPGTGTYNSTAVNTHTGKTILTGAAGRAFSVSGISPLANGGWDVSLATLNLISGSKIAIAENKEFKVNSGTVNANGTIINSGTINLAGGTLTIDATATLSSSTGSITLNGGTLSVPCNKELTANEISIINPTTLNVTSIPTTAANYPLLTKTSGTFTSADLAKITVTGVGGLTNYVAQLGLSTDQKTVILKIIAAADVPSKTMKIIEGSTALDSQISWAWQEDETETPGDDTVPSNKDIAVLDDNHLSGPTDFTTGSDLYWGRIHLKNDEAYMHTINGGTKILNLYGVEGIAMNIDGAAQFNFTFGGVNIMNDQTWNSSSSSTAANNMQIQTNTAGTPFDLKNNTLTKTGTGILQITSGFTLKDGAVVVSGGTLIIQGGNSRITTSTNVDYTVNTGGVLHFQSNSGAVTFGSGVTTTLNGGKLKFYSGVSSIACGANISLNASSTIESSSYPATLSGNITGGETADLNFNTGKITLSGANSYKGITKLSGANLTVQGNQSAADGGWNITSTSAIATLENGSTIAVASGKEFKLAKGTVSANGTIDNSGTFNLTEGTFNNTGTINNAGTITNSAVLNNTGTIDIISGGTFDMNTVSTVGGTVALNGGTLKVTYNASAPTFGTLNLTSGTINIAGAGSLANGQYTLLSATTLNVTGTLKATTADEITATGAPSGKKFTLTSVGNELKLTVADDIGTSVKTANASQFAVYPNPVAPSATLTVTTGLENATISIIDLQGKIVNSVSNTTSLTAPATKGTYIIRVYNDKSSEESKILVK